jgi:hypothetical protein
MFNLLSSLVFVEVWLGFWFHSITVTAHTSEFPFATTVKLSINAEPD